MFGFGGNDERFKELEYKVRTLEKRTKFLELKCGFAEGKKDVSVFMDFGDDHYELLQLAKDYGYEYINSHEMFIGRYIAFRKKDMQE